MFTLFRGAGASGYVFLLSGGKIKNKGLAYSGLIGPLTTVAVVPTIAQSVSFSVNAQSSDMQGVVVSGSVSLNLIPETAVSNFDFTVDRNNGGYLGKWNELLRSKVTEHVVRAIVDTVKLYKVDGVILEQATIETAVLKALTSATFASVGVVVSSCSIPKIGPSDVEVANSIGATERQLMLTASDRALHDRRIEAAKNERAVRQYEADTRLELEKKQGELLEEQSKNKQAEAEADAAATEARLEPLRKLTSGTLLGVSIMELAKNGNLGTLNITSEFLAAVSAAAPNVE